MVRSAKIDLIYKLCADFEYLSLYDQLKELGISPTAPEKDIKKQLRQLAFKYHTDNKETGNKAMFEKVMKAHKALTIGGHQSTSRPSMRPEDLVSIIDRYSTPPTSPVIEVEPVKSESKPSMPPVSNRDWNKPIWGDWSKK